MGIHETSLKSLHLFVKDVYASVRFYRLLGLSIPVSSVWSVGGKGHHVEIPMPTGFVLEIDSIELTQGYDKGWEPSSGIPRSLMMFHVVSRSAVDDLYRTVTASGYKSHLTPFDAFWGARYAIVCDPDENLVGLTSPRDPARQSPLPDMAIA